MGTLRKLMKHCNDMKAELENIKKFLHTIELKINISKNHTKTLMEISDDIESFRKGRKTYEELISF